MVREKFQQDYLDDLKVKVTDFLVKLASIRSYSHEEEEACQFCYDEFSKLHGVRVNKLFIDNSIMQDPLFCQGLIDNRDYTGHYNVEVIWKGTGEQEPIYLNAHIDTVPASRDNMLTPTFDKDGNKVYGLGISDDKSGIATIYSIFSMLSDGKIKLPFDVIGHIVVEEEIGGNGTLAVIRNSELKGQAAIVIEGSHGDVWPIHSCGFALRVTTKGIAVHPSQAGKIKSANACDSLLRAIEIIRGLHEEYEEYYKKNPCKYYEDRMPVMRVAVMQGGDWFGRPALSATAIVSFGLRPHVSSKDYFPKIAAALAADPDIGDKTEVKVVFEREGADLPLDHPFALEVQKHAKNNGFTESKIEAFGAITDAVFYNNYCSIPTVTYGPGGGDTHAPGEYADLDRIMRCSFSIVDLFCDKAK